MSKIYFRIAPKRLFVRNIGGGEVFDAPSCIVFDSGRKKALAFGQEAVDMPDAVGVEKRWPFDDHPRVLIGDFDAAGMLMAAALKSVTGGFSFFAPRIFFHVAKDFSGGISPVELRMLQEMAEACGAPKVRFIPDEQVKSLSPDELEETLKKL